MDYIDKIISMENLEQAFRHIASNRGGPGVDGITIEQFSGGLEDNLHTVRQEISGGAYKFEPSMSVELREQNRTVYILTVRDRTVAQAIAQVLTSPFERFFHPASYAYRQGRSAVHATIELHKELLKHSAPFVLRCDIHHYFDEVDHDTMRQFLIWTLGKENEGAISLILKVLKQPSIYNGQVRTPSKGICQGSPLSPLLSNLYLTPLDRYIEKLGCRHFRFCDDIAVVLEKEDIAGSVFQEIEGFLHQYLKLRLHPEKRSLTAFRDGIDFLGFSISPQGRFPGSGAVERLKKRVAAVADEDEKTEAIRCWEAYYGPGTGAAVNISEAGSPNAGTQKGEEQPSKNEDSEQGSTTTPLRSGFKTSSRLSCALKKTSVSGKILIQRVSSNRREEPKLGFETVPIVSLFLDLFQGNSSCFARAYKTKERYGYTPVKRPIGQPDIIAHILGKETLGVYLLNENRVSFTCLDLDLDQSIIKGSGDKESGELAVCHNRLFNYARQIQTALRNAGFDPILEDSGYKGCHIWLFFPDFIPAVKAVELWRKALDIAGPRPVKIKREIFPRETKSNGGLGSLIKLPLAIHPYSGRRSMFLDDTGEAISNPERLLREVRKADLEMLDKFLNQSINSPKPGSPIERLIAGCKVVSALCQKAGQEKNLGHFERLILLYTLGQLGEEGIEFLHSVISQCENYDRNYTQRQVEKKHPSPMGCRRIQEMMGDALEEIQCRCVFKIPEGGYASPLLHVYPNVTKNLGREVPK